MSPGSVVVAAGRWSPDPSVVASLLLLAASYGVGAARCRAAGRPVTPGRAVAFVGGLTALGVALASPVETLAASLFSAHMVQHLLLVVVAAPLLALSRPGRVLLAAGPRSWRRRAHGLAGPRPVRVGVHRLLHPVTVAVAGVVVLWAWHLPTLYEGALADPVVHLLEHATLLGTAVATWWLVGTRRGPLAIGRPAAVALLFVTALHSSALGAVLSLAAAPLYPTHIVRAPALGVSALSDQQLAGALMWVPPGIVYLVAMVVLLQRWLATPVGDEIGRPGATPRERVR